MATRFQIWTQAIVNRTLARVELEQVRASLERISLDDVDSALIGNLVSDAHNLIFELQMSECEECGHAISRHGTASGCDTMVLLLDAPCGCRRGLVEV